MIITRFKNKNATDQHGAAGGRNQNCITKICDGRRPRCCQPSAISRTAATRLSRRAQGWPRFLRPTLGKGAIMQSTLKGLCPYETLSGHFLSPQIVPKKIKTCMFVLRISQINTFI
jgi:hypothetical protein